MEKRLLLFFAATFVIVSVWWRVFPPPPITEEGGAAAGRAPVEDVEPAATESKAPVAEGAEREEVLEESKKAPSVKEPVDAVAAESEETIVVESDLYRMVLSNRGGRMESLQLKGYRDSGGQPYEMVSQRAGKALDAYPLDVRLEGEGRSEALRRALFRTAGTESRISLRGGEERVVSFHWADGRGLAVEKQLTVHGGRYEIDVVISVEENGQQISKEVLYGAGIGNEGSAGSRFVVGEQGVLVSRGEVALFDAEEIEEGEGTGLSVTAAGVASHYFAALMLPAGEGIYGSRFDTATIRPESEAESERKVITAVLETPRAPAKFRLYAGPKKLEELEALSPGMSRIIEFGDWMRYPALLLRFGLMRIYEFVGNYGWAIVVLTIAINLLLVPLKHYSFVSMRRMQKLAPQIQRIRDRYKKVKPTDPRYQQMNQEIMGLYKQHNVSPVSGCLPMLLMIPFFFAFYRLLMASIELRQAPFLGWIEDLSLHDPYFVLPIMMGVSQLVVQRMTPQTTADPMQAKLMQLMPILFVFFFLWAPAGLVLYWFSNNLVSMGQQVLTNRLLKEREEKEEAAEKAAKKRKRKKGHKDA